MLVYISGVYNDVSIYDVTIPIAYTTKAYGFVCPIHGSGGNWGQQKTACQLMTETTLQVATFGDGPIATPWYASIITIGY